MASPPVTLARRSTLVLLPAITRLAWWRLKQMWRMLFVTWLGMIAMVVLVCSVPLFTQVSNTAGIRAALAALPPSQQRITVNFASTHPTAAQLNQAQHLIDQMLQSNLGAYLSGPAHFSVGLPLLTIQPTGPLASGSQNVSMLAITGYQLDQVGSELTVLQGRLPAASSSQIEIALTQAEARSLKVRVGSVITASFPVFVGQVTWTLRVVGIFATTQNWEYRETSQPQFSGPNSTAYPVLASSAALLPQISSLQVTLNDHQLFGRGGGVVIKDIGGGGGPFFTLSWSYPFSIAHVDANKLSSLLHAANNLSSTLPENLQHIQDAAVSQQPPQGAIFSLLAEYSTDTTISAITITALLLLILSLVLFLVTTMSVALVERQTAAIATLRSRGATSRHVFGAFVAQGIGLGLLALGLGPFLALLLVDWLVHLLLPASALSSLNVLGNNPLLEALSVGWLALAAVIGAVLAVIMAVRQAKKLDVLAFRRESARATRRPFWSRLNLDIIGIVLICLGYGGYHLSQPFLAEQLGTGLLAIEGFMALVAPFLASAVYFALFLRLYPLCLRLGSRLAGRSRKAPPVLALVQMARAPRPASRIILLLSLVISTTMFILTYTATEQQRTIDAANFAVGADFSGPSAAHPHNLTLAQQTAAYESTRGVISATLGYTTSLQRAAIFIDAPDADTYAHTALWTSQYSDQSLSSLMSLLVADRAHATNNDTLDVIIDQAMASNGNYSVGSSFILPTADDYSMHAVVVAVVNAIPGIYDSEADPSNAGVLCDYQSYAAVYANNSGNTLDTNFVWLKTGSGAASLSSVRHAYPNLQDRRALTASDETNPLYVNVIGVLDLSIAAALLLALIGVLFFAWLSASGRLTNFSVLRALGMAPRQIASVLFWEQGSIYVAALVLGLALGLFLLTFVGPALVFTDEVTAMVSGFPTYGLPVQLVTPDWLIGGLLGAVALICGVALVLMARLVAHPSLGQVLRLNED